MPLECSSKTTTEEDYSKGWRISKKPFMGEI